MPLGFGRIVAISSMPTAPATWAGVK